MLSLCAAKWNSYLLDGVVVLFVLGFTFISARKGFIECFFGFVSSIAAVLIAFLFAKMFVNATNGLFGLQGLLEDKLSVAFSKISGFNEDVSGLGTQEALSGGKLPAVLTKLVLSVFGKGEFPVGSTLGGILGVSVAKLAITLFCGSLLFIAVKCLFFLVKKTLTAIVSKITMLGSLDTTLGAAVGLIESLLIVCFILSVLTVIPSQMVTEYLENSLFVGALFDYNPLVHILAFLL